MKNVFYLLIFFFVEQIHSQDYTFSVHNATYQDLENSNSVNNGMTWYDIDFEMPIGFSFKLFGENINSLYFNSDIAPASVVLNTNNPVSLFNAILPYGVALVDRGMNYNTWEPSSGSLSPISYVTEGEEGNRIFKLEWKNTGFEGDLWDYEQFATDYTNFQLWCYENGNLIEYHFGPSHFEHFASSFYEESGPVIGLLEDVNEDGPTVPGLLLSDSPDNPQLVFSTEETYLNGVPSDGIVYRFSPVSMGLSETKNVNFFNIFPNPSSDYLMIKNNGNLIIEEVKIINELGNIILQKSNGFEKLDISDLPHGLFFIEISTNNFSQILTFLKI